jgi:outer membrane protein TolC
MRERINSKRITFFVGNIRNFKNLFLPISNYFKLFHISTFVKKHKLIGLIISIYFYLFLPISSFSQSDSLYHYLDIATKNNPVVLQKFYEYKAALEKVPQVGSLPDPEFSAGVFLSPMEIVNGKQVADLKLMQMFPWFGVLKYGKDEMSLMAQAKFELFRDAKLQVCYDVQRTWYELYKVQKDIDISQKNIEILKVIERLALVKFKSAPSENPGSSSKIPENSHVNSNSAPSGMNIMGATQTNSGTVSNQSTSSTQSNSMGSSPGNSDLTDIYRIQIEKGDLVNNIAYLKNQSNTITARFNSYLNRPFATTVSTTGNITVDSLSLSLTSISDSIMLNNPMLGMLDFEKQSLDAKKKMVTRMGYPMVGIGLDYSLISKSNTAMGEPSMNGTDMIMPMVTLTLPVYRKKNKAMINEADLLKRSTSLEYQSASNSLQEEYYQAVQLYQDAKRRIKLYDNQYQLASKSLDLMLKSFTVSNSPLSDVLRIRQQTLDYELKQVEAAADENTAIAWLKRLGPSTSSGRQMDRNRQK